ncbi:MAG: ADP-ribosylglycohydrolase family protein [Kiritimatiellaeota bacterium]|nr:ADP-ribosylglycohydrolase family protein [Kiritimatiellota bacterium]
MTMTIPPDYERKVYAGLLGKVVGVYMGRPVEGWSRERIEAEFGFVDRYLAEERGLPLVVPDDDISGTLTFIRALEDSGRFADTPDEFFGETWLNYLIEGKTVLWWGGLGHSTEHTAYLRLKHGLRAPASGAIATNGRTVAEQIGAQIFIDAFGLVAPGRPDLAVALARRSARVSHDGEAVHAACVVAALVSAAFVEHDMDRLLDSAVTFIPPDSLIARIHRDVRTWATEADDWEQTFEQIRSVYGYDRYGGNCHVAPNHAVMVMAWAHAPDNFRRALGIATTAGWDTDCNVGNVGSVMGVRLGLEGINRDYDFQTPCADRLILPTAEGTFSTSDVLTQALRLARIGRRVMGRPMPGPPREGDALLAHTEEHTPRGDVHPPFPGSQSTHLKGGPREPNKAAGPKGGAIHHFSLPGAVHGYQVEWDLPPESARRVSVANVSGGGAGAARVLRIRFRGLEDGAPARVSTPLLARPRGGAYCTMGVPRLCPGMVVGLDGVDAKLTGGRAQVALFVRAKAAGGERLLHSEPVELRGPGRFRLELRVPSDAPYPLVDVGVEITGEGRATGELLVDRVEFGGGPDFRIEIPRTGRDEAPGWIHDYDVARGGFSDDPVPMLYLGKNEGHGCLVLGTRDWQDYRAATHVKVHLADEAGLVVRWQGWRRYLALVWRRCDSRLRLVRRFHGAEQLLAESAARWGLDELHALALACRGRRATARCDGEALFDVELPDTGPDCGGAGVIFENGLVGFRDFEVGPVSGD